MSSFLKRLFAQQAASEPALNLYLDLLKGCLTRSLFPDLSLQHDLKTTDRVSPKLREEGKDWPTQAETMIGIKRLQNIQYCATAVIKNQVQGDFAETGVWRGGACIFMRGLLKAYGINDRRVWVADSFEGLPEPNPEQYPRDADDAHHEFAPYLAVSLEQVKANFERYGLLDDQVCFLKGWFKDTLPTAPITDLAVLRLDGDMYESTMDSLSALYDRVRPGGFVIVDDYGCLPNCRAAVDDFRAQRGIHDPIQVVDWTGVFWRKTSPG